ncbi:retrovirus-related pol polyprotein from transposon TNT 1-94 [Tanacetum coccineum]|uniref:Retrovirus-related pol polyprotein from transposon TNT 1-94 n=1 Tax=Tanacetum coccineum TaxID=301880 RepID=A0ABQ5B638_9ASTR
MLLVVHFFNQKEFYIKSLWFIHLNIPKTVFPTFGDEEHDENPTSFTDSVPNDAIPNTLNSPTSDNLNQRKYILDLLTDAGLTAAKPNLSPLPTNLKLSLDKGSPLSDPDAYRRLVGRLLYLTMTRPNISYAVQHLSQFVSSLKDVHLQAAIHLLKYLKGSISKGLFYPIQPHLKIIGFSDAD